ncbi:unnamed protein product [Ascophyllum nodosum]
MDKIVDREFTVLLLCAESKGDVAPGQQGWLTWGRFSLFGQMHSLLPRRYKKNLARLVVFQATPVLHAFFDFAKLFLSPKFYRKLEFCDEVEELFEKFPRGVVESLPSALVPDYQSGSRSRSAECVSAPSGRSTDDPGGGVFAGEDIRPSPVRLVRLDENSTPPPMPPPPLQSTSTNLSPTASAGTEAIAMGEEGERNRAETLERRFSISSGTGPNTPSPIQAKSLRITATGGIDPNGPSPSSGGTTYSSARPPSRTPSGTNSGAMFPSAGKDSARPSILPSAMRKSPSSSSPGGDSFANIPHSTGAIGVSPSGSTGGVVNFQSWRCGSAPTNYHWRAPYFADLGASTPGGAISVGRAGSGKTGWLSPAEAKSFCNHRSTPLSNPVSPWSAAADRLSPRTSPRAGMTPRGITTFNRNHNHSGGSPGSGKRTSPPTPTQSVTQSFSSSSTLGRKGSRVRPQGQPYASFVSGVGRTSDGGAVSTSTDTIAAAGASLPIEASFTTSAGTAVVFFTRFSRDSPARCPASRLFRIDLETREQRAEGRTPGVPMDKEPSPRAQRTLPTKSPRHQQPMKSPRHQPPPTKSPRYMQPTKSPRQIQAVKSQRQLATAYITKFECTFSLPFAVKRLKFRRGSKGSSDSEVRRLPSNSRQTSSNTRRSGQESSLSTRSSCNLIDSVQLAALERAVMDQGARVVNSVAGGSGCSSAVTSKVGFSGETANRGGASDVDVAGAETTHELVPADHPAPLRRASATPKTSKGATRGSASLGGRDVETQTTRSDLKMTTSARIGPGIQALIADYGAASGTQFPGGFGDNVAFQETVAARLFASVGGGGVGLRGRGGDAGRASANGVATKGHRTHHRSDSGGVRRVVREHKETLRKAAAAAAVVKVAGGEGHRADGQEEGKKDGGVASATRRRVPPDPKGKVFGLPLTELIQRTPGKDVPWVLKRFAGYLNKFGLQSVGLFRLAGDGEERAMLRAALDAGKQVCWDPEEEIDGEQDCLRLTDVNMVAQLLKAFVRELPEPLVPFSVYSKVVAIARAAEGPDTRWLQAMRTILWEIPNTNYKCLRRECWNEFLFEFLREVAMHSAINRMTSENLAIVWAPNLVRPEDDDPFAILRDLRFQIETVRWMVDHFDDLFDG